MSHDSKCQIIVDVNITLFRDTFAAVCDCVSMYWFHLCQPCLNTHTHRERSARTHTHAGELSHLCRSTWKALCYKFMKLSALHVIRKEQGSRITCCPAQTNAFLVWTVRLLLTPELTYPAPVWTRLRTSFASRVPACYLISHTGTAWRQRCVARYKKAKPV